MTTGKRRQAGFTILELLTVVAMLMILSALAIPAYTSYVKRSKSSEVTSNLNSLFKNAATYYSMERSGMGMSGTATVTAGACVVNDAGPLPVTPGPQKQHFNTLLAGGASFRAIGFGIADSIYYSYGMDATATPGCNQPKNSPALYTLYANGDLDGDTILSTFEITVASDANNLLYHSVGFYINRETE